MDIIEKYLVAFAIFRADGVLIEHKYAHLCKEDVATQLMAINSQILELVNDNVIDADFKVVVIKEVNDEEVTNLA